MKLKYLKSDNGGEYYNKEFDNYCVENGIRREKIVPNTPQQNGVVKRIIRTIMERARSMRVHVGLPIQFWADAVSTTTYLFNLGPSVFLLEEARTGKQVNLEYLRVFGCMAYIHDADQWDKLDPKSKRCVFIGYGSEEFSYRCWDDKNQKVIRSRNVVFNEKVLDKDKVTVSSKQKEFIEFDKISDDDVQVVNENEAPNTK